jgi:CubicO group peptidase (beta-lactamase class C family)
MGGSGYDSGMKRFLPFLLLAAGSAFGQTAAEVQAILDPIAKQFGVPGLAAAVLHGDGPIIVAATGVKVKGKAAKLRPDSRFHLGSVTKTVTATMIATLVDEGFLSWDLKIANAFPEWRSTTRPEYANVTLAELLAHEGRIQPFTDDAEIAKIPKFEGTPAEQRRAFVRYVLTLEPMPKERKPYTYSNAGYSVAAAMAEHVTGQTWEQLIDERIFKPFEMQKAGFGWPAAQHPDEPWGHWEQKGKLVPNDPKGSYQLPVVLAPADDLHMTLEELARFTRAHLVALRGHPTVIKSSTARQMHTQRNRSGLGWGVVTLLDYYPVSVYSGSAGTFDTMIAITPGADIGVIVATNAGSPQAEAAAKDALRMLIKRFSPPPPERKRAVPPLRKPPVP